MTVPGQTTGVSVFFDPITADLGISRTWASITYAAGTLAGILPAPVIGRWIDRRGPRLTAAIIAGGLALACTVMAAIHNGIMLLVGFALLRGAAIGGLSLVSQLVVNLWFVHRRGIAASAASLGLAAGSMIFPQAIELFISAWGWRGAYLVLAALVAATMLPVAALLFRDRPEKFGLTTDAGLPPVAGKKREDEACFDARASATHRRVLAAVRRRVSHQCDWHRAAAQPLFDHAISRRRSSRCTAPVIRPCRYSSGGDAQHRRVA
jgi:MFS family permease